MATSYYALAISTTPYYYTLHLLHYEHSSTQQQVNLFIKSSLEEVSQQQRDNPISGYVVTSEAYFS